MRKTLLLVLVILLSSAVALFASGEKESGAGEGSEQITIGYTVQSMQNDYFVSLVDGMKAEAERQGIKLIVADASADAAKHVDHINNFIAQQVDAILISPVDQVAPQNAVAKAEEQGIPVVALNQKVEGASAFLLMKEYEYGYMGGTIAGKWLNKKEEDGTIDEILNEQGEIDAAIVRYDTISSLIDRGDGLKDGITETYSGDKEINFVLEQDGADADAGRKIAQTALTAHPNISIISCINDSGALGVFEAARAMGYDKSELAITGLDGIPQALKYISQDTMFIGTVDSQPGKLGADGLKLALRVIEKGPPEEALLADMKTVTTNNIDEYSDVIAGN